MNFIVIFHASQLNGSRVTKVLNCAKNMPVKTLAEILKTSFTIAYILTFNFLLQNDTETGE